MTDLKFPDGSAIDSQCKCGGRGVWLGHRMAPSHFDPERDLHSGELAQRSPGSGYWVIITPTLCVCITNRLARLEAMFAAGPTGPTG